MIQTGINDIIEGRTRDQVENVVDIREDEQVSVSLKRSREEDRDGLRRLLGACRGLMHSESRTIHRFYEQQVVSI